MYINKYFTKCIILIIANNCIIFFNKHIAIIMNKHICSFNTTMCQMIINRFKLYKLKIFRSNVSGSSYSI